MDNIITYLKWRKDISMECSPFNKIDSLILSQLSYTLWGDCINKKFDEPISLNSAIETFFKREYDQIQIDKGYFCSKDLITVLKEMLDAPRYQNIQACGYRFFHDYEKQEQFGALTLLMNKQALVVFCGTDSSFLGWKEDFNMTYLNVVPSQISAQTYLNEAMNYYPDYEFMVSGHSKGGNLSVYAACFLNEYKQNRIIKVFNNDGPGFSDEIVQSDAYQRIQPKIETYVPQSSIIGMIMEHEEDYKVVYSNQKSILQHDPFTWSVEVNDFVYVKEIDKSSIVMDKAMKQWLIKMTPEQKEKFVDIAYQFIVDTGLQNTNQIKDVKLKDLYNAFKKYQDNDDDSKKIMFEGIKLLITSIYQMSLNLNKEEKND